MPWASSTPVSRRAGAALDFDAPAAVAPPAPASGLAGAGGEAKGSGRPLGRDANTAPGLGRGVNPATGGAGATTAGFTRGGRGRGGGNWELSEPQAVSRINSGRGRLRQKTWPQTWFTAGQASSGGTLSSRSPLFHQGLEAIEIGLQFLAHQAAEHRRIHQGGQHPRQLVAHS